ncbi:hypothetical protein FQN54_003999 [Arachnomyces sp. PD_36]|nr:hypothetical protein FQN54_003999 [Arachnomyces sp. PD_36]
MESPSVRRSGRRAAAKRRYTEDAFEAAGLSGGSSEEGTPSGSQRGRINIRDDVSDDEFVLQEDDDGGMDIPLDEEDYGVEEGEGLGESEAFSDESICLSREELGSDLSAGSPSKRRKKMGIPRRGARGDGPRIPGQKGPHYRGLWNPVDHVSKGLFQKLNFGVHKSDRLSIMYVRDRWSKGTDVTFPSRKTLSKEYAMPAYGVGRTFGVEEQDLVNESTKGWDWYYEESVGGRFRKRQKLERLGAEEARIYFPKPRQMKHTIFMGPFGKQKPYELEYGASINFGDAWGHVEPKKTTSPRKSGKDGIEEMGDEVTQTQDNVSTDSLPATEAESQPQKFREGWIINVGEKVNCVDWAPNQEGNTQYLAISAAKEQPLPDEDSGEELEKAPAFTPSEPTPASIQVWTFEAEENDEIIKGLNMESAPSLRAVICTEWGDSRRFCWCPMGRVERKGETSDTINLGLLAGIWGDGFVRVLDVQLKKNHEGVEYLNYQTSFFAARPPSTVCTCVTWLSPNDIAVGCANGFVAVWNLAIPPKDDPQAIPKPYVYVPIHVTYILNIASAYPTYPHLFTTTAMDGQTRQFSILDPQKDLVDSTRMRIGSAQLTYSPHLRSFLYTDESDVFRIVPVRRFFSSMSACKLFSSVSALANSSRWHPSLLGGGTNGSAIVTNPLRNLLHSKDKHFQQNWFVHEWIPAKDGRPEASRFVDGSIAEHVSLVRNLMGDHDKVINGIVTMTIFDEPGQVTALAWNPNFPCSGWACAGMGCGLLRVEDLAI